MTASPRCIFNENSEGEEGALLINDDEKEENSQTLRLYHVNINGLTDEKLNNPDMINDIESADFICLTETQLEKNKLFPKSKIILDIILLQT